MTDASPLTSTTTFGPSTASWPASLTPALMDATLGGVTCGPGERERLTVTAPFFDTVVAHVPRCTAADVTLAVDRARRAQAAWARRSLAERRAFLTTLHDLVLDRQQLLLDLVQLESGKARRDAFEEVCDVALVARYYAFHAARHLKSRRRRGLVPFVTRVTEHRHPYGVVGLIAPWNYPLTLALTDALPALVAGNAVVLKPAEQTSLAALLAARLLYEAGLPDDLFQVVTGPGDVLGPALIRQVDFIGFTGSTDVGRLVARQAGERLIPCSLELGGKNPMLILHDADLDRAVEGAVRGCFSNAGQLCVSFERLYVARPIFDRFAGRLAERVGRMRLAPVFTYDADMGSLISGEQLDKVAAHVADARRRGATLLTGGTPRPDAGPLFYAPTLVTDLPPDALMAREETFGPVVALYPFDTEEEAVRLANDSPYGLNASVWTRDVRRGRAVARQIQAGTVGVNDAYQAVWGSADAPMGGFKESGLGRRHGASGIQKYTDVQSVASRHLIDLAPPPGVTYDAFARASTRLLKLMRRLPGLR